MHTRIQVKTIGLLLAATIPVTGPGADETSTAMDESAFIVNRVELGIGYQGDDAYRFGRYNGLEDEGAYFVGDVDARGYREDGRFWKLRGTNLGLDSRYLRLEGGIQGRQKYFLEYDRLPNNKSDTASTPYLEDGSDVLALPAGFDINTNLYSNLRQFDIETERERIGLGASLFTRQRWTLDVAFRHETRDGTDRIGGAIANGGPGGGGGGGGGGGSGGGGGVVGNTTASLMPEPVDYTTQLLDVTLHYDRDEAQLDIAYHMSLFDNADRSLLWEDPFSPGTFGSQALAPDNEFHQLMITGSYRLPYKSQLTGMLSRGRMTQDQGFQFYTVNPAIMTTALPRSSLDGEVWLTTAQLKLVSRPLSKLRLTAEYRYDERDNDSSVAVYDTIVADSFATTAAVNRPLSYDRNRADLTANYRINSAMSLRGGYRYDEMSRDYTGAEREDTREHSVFARWKLKPHTRVDLALYADASDRDGNSYNPPLTENPAMRKYYLADRERTRAGASIDFLASDRLSLAASADYIRDDYDNSEIGLTEATLPTYTLDLSYQPRDDITTYAWYTREDIESRQAGSEAGTVIPDWKAEFTDTVDTFGAGAKITGIRSKWDVGADLVYTSTTGDVDLDNLAPAGTVTPYPDLETSLTSVKLWTRYRYRRDLSWKLSYRYERFDADNWALDNLQADSIGNLLLLGEETPDYDAHVMSASVIYHF
jgi:MtrB/PioB family decaheme-associated outer membrane protein